MKTLAWSPQMSLGVSSMDDAHKVFVEKLSALESTPDAEFGKGLSVLIGYAERNFRAEENMMEEIDFPALQSHREQHARVLKALHNVVTEVMRSEYAAARKVIKLLSQWFVFHLATMDTALAVALEVAGLASGPAPAPIARQMRHAYE